MKYLKVLHIYIWKEPQQNKWEFFLHLIWLKVINIYSYQKEKTNKTDRFIQKMVESKIYCEIKLNINILSLKCSRNSHNSLCVF